MHTHLFVCSVHTATCIHHLVDPGTNAMVFVLYCMYVCFVFIEAGYRLSQRSAISNREEFIASIDVSRLPWYRQDENTGGNRSIQIPTSINAEEWLDPMYYDYKLCRTAHVKSCNTVP